MEKDTELKISAFNDDDDNYVQMLGKLIASARDSAVVNGACEQHDNKDRDKITGDTTIQLDVAKAMVQSLTNDTSILSLIAPNNGIRYFHASTVGIPIAKPLRYKDQTD